MSWITSETTMSLALLPAMTRMCVSVGDCECVVVVVVGFGVSVRRAFERYRW